ncbi:response regulator transcription factor [Chloroflexota bacterium]
MVKPFKQLELLARVKAMIRRQVSIDEEEPLVFGSLRLDPTTFQLNYGEKEIDLTRTEGQILYHLMKNAGHVVSHSKLSEAVWGEDYPAATDSLKVYISRLREKLEKATTNPHLILTKTGGRIPVGKARLALPDRIMVRIASSIYQETPRLLANACRTPASLCFASWIVDKSNGPGS